MPTRPQAGRVFLRSLMPQTRRVYHNALRRIASIDAGREVRDVQRYGWHRWTFERSLAVRDGLMQQYKPATVCHHLTVLRGVVRMAWRLGLMSWDDCQRAIDVPRPRFRRAPAGRYLRHEEVAALLRAAERDGGARGLRDVALLGLLYGAGLRRDEAAGLTIDRYHLGGKLVVTGKGGADRTVYLGGADEWVTPWLEARGDDGGPLLLQVIRGEIVWRRMGPTGVNRVLERLTQVAGIKATPHDLRRTFATGLLERTQDVFQVQRLLGHRSPETTELYDMRGEDAKAATQRQLYIPRRGRKEDS